MEFLKFSPNGDSDYANLSCLRLCSDVQFRNQDCDLRIIHAVWALPKMLLAS